MFRRRRGRILAVKWGYNPNSSSLGVDVTFLLFGMAAVALLTPIVSLIQSRKSARLCTRSGDPHDRIALAYANEPASTATPTTINSPPRRPMLLAP